eukprot:PhF_6_TR15447/c0_g1_i3/m.23980
MAGCESETAAWDMYWIADEFVFVWIQRSGGHNCVGHQKKKKENSLKLGVLLIDKKREFPKIYMTLYSSCVGTLEIIRACNLQTEVPTAPNSYVSATMCTSRDIFRTKTVFASSDPIFGDVFTWFFCDGCEETIELRVWDRDGQFDTASFVGENRLVVCDLLRRHGHKIIPIFRDGVKVGMVEVMWKIVNPLRLGTPSGLPMNNSTEDNSTTPVLKELVLEEEDQKLVMYRLSKRMQRLDSVFRRAEHVLD